MREEDIKLVIDATIGAAPKAAILERFSYLDVSASQLGHKLLQIAEVVKDADGVV